MSNLTHVLRIEFSSQSKCIKLNDVCEQTKWLVFDEIIESNCFVKSLQDVTLLPYETALQYWQLAGTCCVIGIAQSADFQNSYWLILVPNNGPVGGVVCSYYMVKNELRFDQITKNFDACSVWGISECYLKSDKNYRIKVFPLQNIYFCGYVENIDPHISWDQLMTTKTVTASFSFMFLFW
jgi:hypothetical protein